MLERATVTRRAPGEFPFDDATPPLAVLLKLAPAPQWRIRQNSAGDVPEPFSLAESELVEKTLIPYGCTQLRIAQFPIVKDQEE